MQDSQLSFAVGIKMSERHVALCLVSLFQLVMCMNLKNILPYFRIFDFIAFNLLHKISNCAYDESFKMVFFHCF